MPDDDTALRRPTMYDDATDCMICPQVATDRDDALNELEACRPVIEAAQAWASEYVIATIEGRPVSSAAVNRLLNAVAGSA